MAERRFEEMTEVEIGALMRALAWNADRILRVHGGEGPPKFALLVFNDPAAAQYISSCNREDMVRALRESADRLEARQEVPRVPWKEPPP